MPNPTLNTLLLLSLSSLPSALGVPTVTVTEPCHIQPLAIITPSPNAKPITITKQGQRITTYTQKGHRCYEKHAKPDYSGDQKHHGGKHCEPVYEPKEYNWYSTYIPAFPLGGSDDGNGYAHPQYVTHGDDIVTLSIPQHHKKMKVGMKGAKGSVHTFKVNPGSGWHKFGDDGWLDVYPGGYEGGEMVVKYMPQREHGEEWIECTADEYFSWMARKGGKEGHDKEFYGKGGHGKGDYGKGDYIKGDYVKGGYSGEKVHVAGYEGYAKEAGIPQALPAGGYEATYDYGLSVKKVKCRGEHCRKENMKWDFGYEQEVKEAVVDCEFTGWCEGKGLCEVTGYAKGYGTVKTKLYVDEAGLCTTSTKATITQTQTKTITRTRTETVTSTVEATATDTATMSESVSVSGLPTPSVSAEPTGTESSMSSMMPPTSIQTSEIEPTVTSLVPPTSIISSETEPPVTLIPPTSTIAPSASEPYVPSATTSEEPSPPINTNSFRVRIRSLAPSTARRLNRRQGPNASIYVAIIDSELGLTTDADEIANFGINSVGQLLNNGATSPQTFVFADGADVTDFNYSPLIVGDIATGPDRVWSIAAGSNEIVWSNGDFEGGSSRFCVDEDDLVNGVYKGTLDLLCSEVELIAEFGPMSIAPPASSEPATPTSTLSISPPLSLTAIPTNSQEAPGPSGVFTNPPPGASCTSLSPSTNLLQNPSFDAGSSINPWTTTTTPPTVINLNSTAAFSSPNALQIVIPAPGESSGALSQKFTTCPQRTYTGSLQVRAEIPDPGLGRSCSMRVFINGQVVTQQGATSNDYTRVPFTFTATDVTTTLEVLFGCVAGEGTAVAPGTDVGSPGESRFLVDDFFVGDLQDGQ